MKDLYRKKPEDTTMLLFIRSPEGTEKFQMLYVPTMRRTHRIRPFVPLKK